jgi:hypothetical protein
MNKIEDPELVELALVSMKNCLQVINPEFIRTSDLEILNN